MNHEQPTRASTVPLDHPLAVPAAPPLPAPRPLQLARHAATKLFGYGSRPPSPSESLDETRFARGGSPRYASLGVTQNATGSHKTGLEINTIAINERGTHALLGGKEIFKTIRVENGSCTEDLNLRSAIRSNPVHATGKLRQNYSVDIADVAWAKGDCGNYVAAATSSGKIVLYDLGHAGLQAAQLHEHFRQVHKLTFNPHRGNLLLSGSQDGTVRLWDVRDVNHASVLQSKRKYSGQSDGVRDVKWSPTEGVDFAFGTDSGWIQRWDMRNLKTAKIKIPAHSSTCSTIDWHPDGKHILSASFDKTIRVWDFSINRRQKSSWEITTPYPVLHARWRPSCESSMSQDNGARQCTQLVTSYDREHPVLHIWDFRRPALPFREMNPYPSAPSDLTWHSQDLLWTVGREGVFLQSDIQHAPKVIARRTLQSLGVSSRGELNFVTQGQRRRGVLKPPGPSDSLFSLPSDASQSPDSSFLSRSWADDSLDHSFLSVELSKRQIRSSHKSRATSISTGTSEKLQVPTVKLDDILLHRRSFRPRQGAVRGSIPYARDPRIFEYLAKNYKIDLRALQGDDGYLSKFERALSQNEEAAESSSLYRVAQTWKIAKVVFVNRLRERSQTKRSRSRDPQRTDEAPKQDRFGNAARRLLAGQTKSPAQTPVSMRPVSTVKDRLAASETLSSLPTPLAKPAANGTDVLAVQNRLPDPDKEHLALPPSLGLKTQQSTETLEQGVNGGRRLTAHNLDGLSNLHAHGSAAEQAEYMRRWSAQPKEPLSVEPVDSNGKVLPPRLEKHDSNESFEFLETSTDSKVASFSSSLASSGSEKPLKMVSERPSRPVRTEAAFLVSQDSSKDDQRQGDVHKSSAVPIPGSEVAIPRRDHANGVDGKESGRPAVLDRTQTRTEAALGVDSYPDENGVSIKLGLSQTPARVTIQDSAKAGHKDGGPVESMTRFGQPLRVPQSDVSTEAQGHDSCIPSDLRPEDDEPDIELDKPFALIEMLRELLAHYAANADAQTASTLLLLLSPLLPHTHAISQPDTSAAISIYTEALSSVGLDITDLTAVFNGPIHHNIASGVQPLLAESILSSYHDQLLAHGLFNEAVSLRKQAYPALPALYDDAIKDNTLHLACTTCHRPLDPATSRCPRCPSTPVCPVCWSATSPFPLVPAAQAAAAAAAADDDDDPSSTPPSIRTSCPLCDHSGHAACLRVWFDPPRPDRGSPPASGGGGGPDPVLPDGGCPTPGCLCDCARGSWRSEKARIRAVRARSPKGGGNARVKSDEWRAGESGAVKRTGEVLRGKGSG